MWLILLSLIAGGLLPLAFAPFNFYTLGFIIPAVLLSIWRYSTPWQACYRGYLFGLGFFGVGTSWVYISIHHFGNASIPLALLVTGLFIAFLSLYPALQGCLFQHLGRNKPLAVQCLLIFPPLWLASEAFRSTLFSGFPWLLLGYSQMNTPLAALAPIVGVYGVSLAVCLISGCLVSLATPKQSVPTRISGIIIITLLFGSSWILAGRSWTQPAGEPMTVSLIQGNIAQQMKWKPQQLNNILKIYKNLTTPLLGTDLIIWPEAAVPIFPQEIPDYYLIMNNFAKRQQSYLIIGSPIYDPQKKAFYNGLELIGQGSGRYLKRHLVPFGEYTPLTSVFGNLMRKLNFPMSNFSPGPMNQQPLQIKGFNVASFICYEIAFSLEVLRYSKKTQLLVNISDDSWFGRSIALNQQEQMARFRALEVSRPLLSSTNTGITAIINPSGEIVASVPIDQRKVLTHTITPMKGNTPLMRWDYYPLMIISFILLLIGIMFPQVKKRSNDNGS